MSTAKPMNQVARGPAGTPTTILAGPRLAAAAAAAKLFVCSCCVGERGRSSCWTGYRLESQARLKSPDAIVGTPTELSDLSNSVLLPRCYGLHQTQPHSLRRLQKQACARPSDGYQARSRRLTKSSKRRCTRLSSEIKKCLKHGSSVAGALTAIGNIGPVFALESAANSRDPSLALDGRGTNLRLFNSCARLMLKRLSLACDFTVLRRQRGVSKCESGVGPDAGNRSQCHPQAVTAGETAPEFNSARWSSPEARQAHNLEVVGSNPTCATSSDRVAS